MVKELLSIFHARLLSFSQDCLFNSDHNYIVVDSDKDICLRSVCVTFRITDAVISVNFFKEEDKFDHNITYPLYNPDFDIDCIVSTVVKYVNDQ